MKKSRQDMRALGRKGGKRGGRARAKALDADRRSEIASIAAQTRWRQGVLVLRQPRDLAELECFVSQYGNGYARTVHCDPTAVLLRATTACRDNACLARMLPVFIWRARAEIFSKPRRLLPASPEQSRTMGYFLELTGRLGRFEVVSWLLSSLRRRAQLAEDPLVLFHSVQGVLLLEAAKKRTSALAKSWRLVTGEPDESYGTYFQKVTSWTESLRAAH